jgi:cell division protease FtsH
LLKGISKYFLVFLLLFSFLCPTNIYGAEDSKRTRSVEKGVVTESAVLEETEKSLDWLSGFIEITEEDLYKELESTKITSGIQNTTSNFLYVTLENGKQYKIKEYDANLISYIKLNNIEYNLIAFEEAVEKSPVKKVVSNANTWFLLCLIILFITPYAIYKKKNTAVVAVSSGGTTSTKDSDGVPDVKFDDVEGIEELKSDIMRIVDCLKNPKKYEAIGARTTKGVILYGPPGTGKTLIAKAIAGEAGVPFFSMVGSDFVEKYVGVGAQRVRDLYKKARKAAPCIVFIDEVDAVAGQRGRDENTESDQTINALLAELDGFKSSDNIVTICATNRLDMLDSAFKRAGRFDLKLAVGLPDKKGRERILGIHSKNKKLHSEVDLSVIANKTVGFSGAELETLLNEAALVAVGKDKKEIDYEDIDDAFFKLVMQGNKKKRDKVTEVNRVVAWHEAGHTLATKLLTDDNVPSVTIVGSSSGAGGVTFRTPQEDNILHSKKYLESLVKVMYAGRAAEEIYFGDEDSITTGASQDIKQASGIIKEYLSIYGMGKMGMLDLGQFRHDYQDIIEEASEMAQRLYSEVLDLFKDNYDTLKELSEELLEKESLDETEIDAIVYKNKI